MSGRAEEIEVFIQIYDSKSLSAAGVVSGRAPSAVSRILQRLENRLGTQLFYRNSRNVRPTDEGDVFYQHCVEALKLLDAAEASVSNNGLESGVLRVNLLPSFATYQLAPLMPEFHARHPKLRIEFMLGARPSDPLEQGIDVALYSGHQPDSSLVARRLTTTRWMLVASPAYLASRGTPLVPQDLDEHTCLSFAFDTWWNTWNFRNTSKNSVNRKPSMVSDQGEMLLSLALAGMGITRLAHYHVHEHLADGRLVQVLEDYADPTEEPIYLLYRSRHNLSSRLKIWIEFLEEKFSGRPPWLR